MTDEAKLVHEKLEQVPAILEEQGIDLWLTFVHETQVMPDPCMDLVIGTHCTWLSAFLLSRSGERTAIVGRYDAPGLAAIGAYSDIRPYDESALGRPHGPTVRSGWFERKKRAGGGSPCPFRSR